MESQSASSLGFRTNPPAFPRGGRGAECTDKSRSTATTRQERLQEAELCEEFGQFFYKDTVFLFLQRRHRPWFVSTSALWEVLLKSSLLPGRV